MNDYINYLICMCFVHSFRASTLILGLDNTKCSLEQVWYYHIGNEIIDIYYHMNWTTYTRLAYVQTFSLPFSHYNMIVIREY